ncbi:MAG: nuclear transport factor 2 family protein [Chromatiales bacterium]|nr:MAG: nuclear transport factor 2 family protein [Chromatiales bacterium]
MTEAREAIQALMNEYCFRLDAGDMAGCARLFEHGTWRVLGDPRGGEPGAEAMMETLKHVILYDGKPLTKHAMTNVQIDLGPGDNHATAQCYITVFQAVPPGFPLQPIFSGHYRDVFEQVGGEWRFTKRDISPDLLGDLSRHRADMA